MLALANLAASADKAVVAVYAPELRTAFHLNDGQIGALQGGPFLVGYVLALLWAGRRGGGATTGRYIAVCIAFWTVGAVVFALAPGYAELLAGRLLLAIGQAAFAPAAILLLNALYGAAQGDEPGEASGAGAARFVSLFTAASTVGRSLGLMLGGALITAAVALAARLPDLAPWRLSGLALLAPNLILLVLFLRSRQVVTTSAAASGLVETLRHVAGRARPVLIWTVAGCGMILAVQACAAWAPSILHRQFGVPVGTSGVVIGLITLVAAPLGHLGAGQLVSRSATAFRRSALLLAAAALLSAGFAGVVAASTVEALSVAALAGLMAASGFGAALVLIRIQPFFPRDLQRGANSLFLVATTTFGTAAGPVITGLVSDHVAADGGRLPLALAVVTIGAGSVVALAALTTVMFQRPSSPTPASTSA